MRPVIRAASAAILVVITAVSAGAQSALQRGIQLFEADKFPQAEQFFGDVVKREPSNHTAIYYLARSIAERDIARLDRLDEIKKLMEKAISLQPDNSDYHLWYGRTLGAIALNSGKLKMMTLAGNVKNEFETAVKLNPSSIDARIAAMEYYLNAPGIAGGSKEKAMQQADAVRRLSSYRGALAVASVHSANSNWRAAEQELRTIGKSHPDSTDVGVQLLLMYQKAKRYDRAFAAVDSLQRVKPGEPTWLYQTGRIATLAGEQLDRGEQALKAYLKLPEHRSRTAHAVARYRLGLIYEKQGRKDLAKQEFQATLADQPRHAEAKKALGRVK